MKTWSYWRVWWVLNIRFKQNRNSFKGLSSESSYYGAPVFQGNAFGACRVEGMTTLLLLRKRNIVIVQFEQYSALLPILLASDVLVCLFIAAAP